MEANKSSLERAFDLARSGTCLTIADIGRGLKSEGYSVADLEGRSLRRQLKELIRKSALPLA
jgi:hypothetical protein